MTNGSPSRVAIACQGGGSHTAFTAGVLQGLLEKIPSDVEIVALSGTSGGAICAALAWDAMSAKDLLDQIVNQSLMSMMTLRDLMVLPEVSPYHLPPWGEEKFRAILDDYFDFEELRALARRQGAPVLKIGAVEVLSGHFELFTGEELCAEALLASAAIPEMFRAVSVPGRGMFWDGLFSQNPPIHDLIEHQLDELWLVQINSSTCARVPTDTHEILDRRNALSGNLSMEQELKFIETINRALTQGRLNDPKFRRISVSRIELDRELEYRSKLDRRPELLGELRAYGQMKWRRFVKEREARFDERSAFVQESRQSV